MEILREKDIETPKKKEKTPFIKTKPNPISELELGKIIFLLLTAIKKDLSLKESQELYNTFRKQVDYKSYQDIETVSKNALTIHEAIICILDNIRTSRFIRGLSEAIEKLRENNPSQKLEMIDAGSGPIPIYAITAALLDPNIKITCLELNETSSLMAQEIIEKFGLSNKIQVINADATKYKHNQEIDLLISETMFVGLTNEAQIQIMQNLTPQVKNTGISIPEEITANVGLIAKGKEARSQNMPTVKRFSKEISDNKIQCKFEIKHNGFYTLYLSSDIKIFGNISLTKDESVISRPTRVQMLTLKKGMKIEISYTAGTPIEQISIKIID